MKEFLLFLLAGFLLGLVIFLSIYGMIAFAALEFFNPFKSEAGRAAFYLLTGCCTCVGALAFVAEEE